jgi:hypothetical protein
VTGTGSTQKEFGLVESGQGAAVEYLRLGAIGNDAPMIKQHHTDDLRDDFVDVVGGDDHYLVAMKLVRVNYLISLYPVRIAPIKLLNS